MAERLAEIPFGDVPDPFGVLDMDRLVEPVAFADQLDDFGVELPGPGGFQVHVHRIAGGEPDDEEGDRNDPEEEWDGLEQAFEEVSDHRGAPGTERLPLLDPGGFDRTERPAPPLLQDHATGLAQALDAPVCHQGPMP